MTQDTAQTLARLRDRIEADLEIARADLRSSAKLPDGYAHGFTNGRIDALTKVLTLLDERTDAQP